MSDDQHGFKEFKEVAAERLAQWTLRTFFDVGANVGQTVQAVRAAFPDAKIWAFEPVPAAYALLQERCGALPGVTLQNLALGSGAGRAIMTNVGASTGNRLVTQDYNKGPTVEIEIVRGDDKLAEMGLDVVSYLKIDTEGNDLAVLVGFQKTLADQRIDVVEVEASLNPDNKIHVPFERFKAYLEPMGYRLLQIKSVASEKHYRGQAHLRRCNMVFVSRAVVEHNTVERGPKVRAAGA